MTIKALRFLPCAILATCITINRSFTWTLSMYIIYITDISAAYVC